MLASLIAPAAGAQTKGDVERANEAREEAYARLVEVRAEMDAAVEEYEAIWAELSLVEHRIDRLNVRLTRDQEEADDLARSARELVVSAYINGSNASVEVAVEATSIQDLVTSQALIDRANSVSLSALDRLDAMGRELDRLGTALQDDSARLEELQAASAAAVERMNVVMERAREEFNRQDAAAREARKRYEEELARQRAEEEARRRAAGSKKSSGGGKVIGGLVCPSGTPMYFRNDWGNPRSGGRTHKGTDIFAAKGVPVYAVTSGSLRTRTGGLGGIALWLYGDDGHAYYYAHLNGWASGISTGTRVSQGAVIGYVGNTGNASGGATHTHFEIHPNRGAAVNPYWTLAQVCQR
jgi:murein DD-endopeptidase MepM/ murein hydrolase activator NlpD